MLMMTLEHEEGVNCIGVDATLKAARHMYALLRAVEKGITGKRAQMLWYVNVYSLYDRTVLEFRPGGGGQFEKFAREVAEGAKAVPPNLDLPGVK